MKSGLIQRLLLTWVLFVPIAVLNGIIRESVYMPVTGEQAAHQISTVIAIAAYLVLVYIMFRKSVAQYSTQILFLVGGIWVCMTIGFEFAFGYYLDGRSLELLMHDYDLTAGRVWTVFLLVMFFSLYLTKIFVAYLHVPDGRIHEEVPITR